MQVLDLPIIILLGVILGPVPSRGIQLLVQVMAHLWDLCGCGLLRKGQNKS